LAGAEGFSKPTYGNTADLRHVLMIPQEETILINQTVSTNPKGTDLSRYIRALVLADGDMLAASAIADDWRGSPAVAWAFRSAVTAVDMTDAAVLKKSGIATELLEAVRANSIVGKLQDKMRHVPFLTTVSRESTGAAAAWVGEAAAIPVQRLTYSSNVVFEPLKIATIVPITQELARQSTPSAEKEIRRSMVRGIAKTIDTSFLTPTAAVSGVQPAGVTNGISPITSTGSTDAQIEADLKSMLDALGSSVAPYWIAKPKTMAKLSWLFGAQGYGFPNIMGFPFIASENSPAQITLLDADAILLADEGATELSASRNATLEMDDMPAQGETSPISAISSLKSLFQNDLVAVRAIRWLNFARGADDAVTYMTVSY